MVGLSMASIYSLMSLDQNEADCLVGLCLFLTPSTFVVTRALEAP
jgi:hypothetical protein